MRRAFWFAAGAGAGVYAMTKARRAAEILTPEGLADHLAGLSLGLRLFGDEVRAGMVEKEGDNPFACSFPTSASDSASADNSPCAAARE